MQTLLVTVDSPLLHYENKLYISKALDTISALD